MDDFERRMTRMEEKLDALAEQLRQYHEELLRNYYTKPEIDTRLSVLPGMLTEITRLKEVDKHKNTPRDSKGNNYIIWVMAFQIILILALIIAQLVGAKITGVV